MKQTQNAKIDFEDIGKKLKGDIKEIKFYVISAHYFLLIC
jgi:hypothetical protein